MKVWDHPRGHFVTLDEREQFAITDGRGSVRACVVTVFEQGDDDGPYFTVAGVDLSDGGARELEHRFRDAGLLPPHVREAARGVNVMDFPESIQFQATLAQVPDIQRGVSPRSAVAGLPRRESPLAVRRYPQRGQ